MNHRCQTSPITPTIHSIQNISNAKTSVSLDKTIALLQLSIFDVCWGVNRESSTLSARSLHSIDTFLTFKTFSISLFFVTWPLNNKCLLDLGEFVRKKVAFVWMFSLFQSDDRSISPEVLLGKVFLNICCKFTGEHSYPHCFIITPLRNCF